MEVLAVEQLPSGDRPLNLRQMLEHLRQAYQATNVLVEGGAATHGRFLDQQFIDEIVTFIAPRVLAGAGHLPPVAAGRTTDRIADALPLRLIEHRRIDQDVMIRYRIDR